MFSPSVSLRRRATPRPLWWASRISGRAPWSAIRSGRASESCSTWPSAATTVRRTPRPEAMRRTTAPMSFFSGSRSATRRRSRSALSLRSRPSMRRGRAAPVRKSASPARTTSIRPRKAARRRRNIASVLEAVAHAADGLDDLALLAELAAQGGDVDVDGTVDHRRVVAPRLRDEVLAGDDPTARRRERPEHLELGGREDDLLARGRHRATADVDLDLPGLQELLGRPVRVRATEQGLHARGELPH